MKIITISNEKGGVGKTTFAVNVAAGLAARGQRVLLVDADAQGSATASLGVKEYDGLFSFLVDNAEPADVIARIPPKVYGCPSDVPPLINGARMSDEEKRQAHAAAVAQASRLHLLGSDAKTAAIPVLMNDPWHLANRLAALGDAYDYCIIDTSPTPSPLHGAIYLATRWVVAPTACEYLAAKGLSDSLGRVDQARAMSGAPIAVAGIIPNMYREGTLEHETVLRELQARYGELVWPRVPMSIVWGEGPAYGLPLFVHVPTHDATKKLNEVINRIEEATRE